MIFQDDDLSIKYLTFDFTNLNNNTNQEATFNLGSILIDNMVTNNTSDLGYIDIQPSKNSNKQLQIKLRKYINSEYVEYVLLLIQYGNQEKLDKIIEIVQKLSKEQLTNEKFNQRAEQLKKFIIQQQEIKTKQQEIETKKLLDTISELQTQSSKENNELKNIKENQEKLKQLLEKKNKESMNNDKKFEETLNELKDTIQKLSKQIESQTSLSRSTTQQPSSVQPVTINNNLGDLSSLTTLMALLLESQKTASEESNKQITNLISTLESQSQSQSEPKNTNESNQKLKK